LWVSRELIQSGLTNVVIMQEDDNRAGIRTDNKLKNLMAIVMNEKLRSRTVFFYKHFVTLAENITPESMKKDILQQLKNYSRIIRPSKDVHKPTVEFYRG